MKFQRFSFCILVAGCFLFFPMMGFASVESTLTAVQSKLVNTILPLAAILGLVFAGLSYVTGNPGACQHLIYAIIGAVVGFGSQAIISFIRGLVN